MTSSFGVVSLLDMLKFAAEDFWKASELLAKISTTTGDTGPDGLSDEWAKTIESLRSHLQKMELSVSLSQFDKLFSYMTSVGKELAILPPDERARKGKKVADSIQVRFDQLSSVIHSEIGARVFFYASPGEVACYDKPELFSTEVNAKFPNVQFDIVEAGNCYAMGRATACVFHLMRIMEVGVQKLGTKLGVTLVEEKNWQDILNQINAPISKLPPKSSSTRQLAEAAAHLYQVKLAWRNEVMHPKETYTTEEALNLLLQVRNFMVQLASIV
jgi:hypothetical protein